MAAANTRKSVQHALESAILGTASAGVGTAGGPGINKYTITATVPSAAVSITGVVTATANGVKLGDIVLVGDQSAPVTGTGLVGGYASAADTITLANVATTGGYTGASHVYNV